MWECNILVWWFGVYLGEVVVIGKLVVVLFLLEPLRGRACRLAINRVSANSEAVF